MAKQEEKFEIIKKKGKLKYKVKGKMVDIMDTLLDVNIEVFVKCIFAKQERDIEVKDKFELLDLFMTEMKNQIEQGIVYNT